MVSWRLHSLSNSVVWFVWADLRQERKERFRCVEQFKSDPGFVWLTQFTVQTLNWHRKPGSGRCFLQSNKQELELD